MCLKAIELDGSLAGASALRGFILLMLRRYDEGVAEVERAHQLAPNNPFVMYWYGTVLLFVDREEEAIPALKKVLRLNPRERRLPLHWWDLQDYREIRESHILL